VSLAFFLVVIFTFSGKRLDSEIDGSDANVAAQRVDAWLICGAFGSFSKLAAYR
jgi:hypothetical protein